MIYLLLVPLAFITGVLLLLAFSWKFGAVLFVFWNILFAE